MSGDGYRVGVLGATGLVGTTILELLAARDFPAAELRPLASERSAGKQIEWGGAPLDRAARSSEDTIQGLDLVLSSAGGSVSAEWTPKLVEAGAVVVDNTSYWRMHDDVPLVVSEVNPEALEGHKRDRRQPQLLDDADGRRAEAAATTRPGSSAWSISTYQAVSGTGKAAIDELLRAGARDPPRRARRRRPIYPAPDRLQRRSPRPAASPTATTTPTRSAS